LIGLEILEWTKVSSRSNTSVFFFSVVSMLELMDSFNPCTFTLLNKNTAMQYLKKYLAEFPLPVSSKAFLHLFDSDLNSLDE